LHQQLGVFINADHAAVHMRLSIELDILL